MLSEKRGAGGTSRSASDDDDVKHGGDPRLSRRPRRHEDTKPDRTQSPRSTQSGAARRTSAGLRPADQTPMRNAQNASVHGLDGLHFWRFDMGAGAAKRRRATRARADPLCVSVPLWPISAGSASQRSSGVADSRV